MTKKIYKYLDQLLEKSICHIGRTSNMLWLEVGEILKETDMGQMRRKGTIALCVQCSWRVLNKEKNMILFASSDFYSPNSKIGREKDFDWDTQGNNLFDEKSKIWLSKNGNVFVNEYKTNRWGDLFITFSNGDCLEIMIDVSDYTECWRILKRGSNEEHLVATGLGVTFLDGNNVLMDN